MVNKMFFLYTVLFVFLSMLTQALFIAHVPDIIFYLAKHRSEKPLNTVIHAPVTNAKLRKVVLPNPDFIYSAVFYDISEYDLQISTHFPSDSQYACMAFYNDKAQPYFIINNLNNRKGKITVGLTSSSENDERIKSPSRQGVILMRYLVKDSFQMSKTFMLQKMFRINKI
jgi:uncharacterized membrane protein